MQALVRLLRRLAVDSSSSVILMRFMIDSLDRLILESWMQFDCLINSFFGRFSLEVSDWVQGCGLFAHTNSVCLSGHEVSELEERGMGRAGVKWWPPCAVDHGAVPHTRST